MNSRSAQFVAAGLAFLLILVIAVTIFILLSGPNTPSPSPSPTGTGVAVVSPSASALPSPTGLASPSTSPAPTDSLVPTVPPTDTPSPIPTITASPTISPSPSPSPTPSATPPPPTSPRREITLRGLGLERTSDKEGVERVITFGVDGPSLLTVRIANLSAGQVRVCIAREAENRERICQRMRAGTMTRQVLDTGHSDWHVSLISPSQAQPSANVTIGFNSSSPRVDLANFRFNGTTDANYNGFRARVTALDSGDLRVQADFEGDSFQWHLELIRTGDNAVLIDQDGGPDSSIDIPLPVTAAETYQVELSSPEELAGGGVTVAFVHAVLTWP